MTCHVHNLTQKTDPTHTLEVRENFRQDIAGRFERVRGAIRRTLGYENDAFNLSQNVDKIDATEAYDFPTDREKIDAFMNDLRQWIRDEILEPVTFTDKRNGNHWTSEYVLSAYLIGHRGAVGRLKQEGASAEVLDPQDVTNRPISQKTLRNLYTRTYENLQGITDDMADEIRQELTEGFAEGEGPREIADRITNKVSTIQKNRAETLARSEVINAHSQSTLDQYEIAGVEVVGHSYWDAADDSRTCPFCSALDGVPIKISEARGNASVRWAQEAGWKPQTWRLIPPSHPNCRCSLRPAVGADAGDLDSLENRISSVFDGASVNQ